MLGRNVNFYFIFFFALIVFTTSNYIEIIDSTRFALIFNPNRVFGRSFNEMIREQQKKRENWRLELHAMRIL